MDVRQSKLEKEKRDTALSKSSFHRSTLSQQALRGEKAFTLIEIVIAVAILGAAMVTLIGLQSSAISLTVSDDLRIEAIGVARRILSHVDLLKADLKDTKAQGSPSEVLAAIAPSADPLGTSQDSRMNVSLSIEPWDVTTLIPNAPPNVLKRVTLTIAWSQNPLDSITIHYTVALEPP
jgi:prepilin-type N-terminal cleavage/methylation domain-containing protein